ncbi:30S ribosomal protein S21 [bacterium]|nr:30S ribosomal protein S21 [bacterium]
MVKQERRPGESIDSMLRRFKKDIKREGTLLEYKKREFFEKPSDIKKRKLKAAKKRARLQQKANELY